jgi:hypothetical protein
MNFEIVHRVSGAADLSQVKIPERGNFASLNWRLRMTTKKKSPGLPGFFDELLFCSVHFASLAI